MCATSDEIAVITWQLGREPRGRFEVVYRCSFGYPVVVETSPVVDGKPFPTLHWLTCPHLREEISRLESEGYIRRYQEMLESSQEFRCRFSKAIEADRRRKRELAERLRENAPWIEELGIGGVRDLFAVKCLHLHVASYLGGIPNPIGEDVLKLVEPECSDGRCALALEELRR